MGFSNSERSFVAGARVARLATVGPDGTPHVVPICHAFVRDGHGLVFALDEKPKRVAPRRLKRVRNIRANPTASLVVDRYSERWAELGWVRVTGPAGLVEPDDPIHAEGIDALREKYPQYADHDLSERPLVRIDPHRVRSWGALEPPPDG